MRHLQQVLISMTTTAGWRHWPAVCDEIGRQPYLVSGVLRGGCRKRRAGADDRLQPGALPCRLCRLIVAYIGVITSWRRPRGRNHHRQAANRHHSSDEDMLDLFGDPPSGCRWPLPG
jgi:cytochrome bd-type quinol oxidase subunit 1